MVSISRQPATRLRKFVAQTLCQAAPMASDSSQTPPVHLATFTDLAAIPEDRRFHEILDGELVHKLAPSFEDRKSVV